MVERKNAQETSEFLLSTFRTLDASEVAAPPKTIAEYLQNTLMLLKLNKTIGFEQRKILLLTLARGASGNFNTAIELKKVLDELDKIAKKTNDTSLAAEVILIRMDGESSAFTKLKYVDLLKAIDVRDPVLKLRIEITIIFTLEYPISSGPEILNYYQKLQRIIAGQENLLVSSRVLSGIYLLTISDLAAKFTDRKKGINVIESALEIFDRTSVEKAEALNRLSQIYRADKQFELALQKNQEAREIHAAILGEDADKIEVDLNMRGKILMDMGKLTEGRRALEEAIAHAERFGEARYSAVAAISMNLGLRCQNLLNDQVCALKNLKRAVDAGLKVWGADDPNVATFRVQYARAIIASDPEAAYRQVHLAAKILPKHNFELSLLVAYEHLKRGRLQAAKAEFSALCRAEEVETLDIVEIRIVKELALLAPTNCKPSSFLQ